MANDINSSFRTEVLSLNDQVYIMEGDFDPSTGAGQEATKGSLFMRRDTTDLYKKVGPADTDWTIVASADAAAIFAAMGEPTGFPNRTDSEFSFDVPTRTFTIQPYAGSPAATEYDYWIKGVKFTITGSPITRSVVIPNVTGLYWVYLDNTETLNATATFDPSLITSQALVATLYWNATNSQLVYLGDERHGITMDGATHLHFHIAFGTQYVSGLAVGGTLTADPASPTNADVQFSVADGTIRDEDLSHFIADIGNGVNVYDLEQELSPIAALPVMYRTGTGEWRKKSANNFPFIYSDGSTFTGANGRIPYNQLSGTWQLTEIGENSFIFVHVYATNDVTNPVVAFQGITEYTSIPSGRDEAATEIKQIEAAGLPSAEFVPIASFIVESSVSYTNTPKARIRSTAEGGSYVDWLVDGAAGGGGGVTDHGALTGLADDDHTQYALAGSGSVRTFDIGDLYNVVDLAHVLADDGKLYGLVWDHPSSEYDITAVTLNSLTDVTVANGPAIDGYTLTYDDATSTWKAVNTTQNVYTSVTDGSNTATADSATETLTFSAGTGISIVVNPGTDTVSITNTLPNVDQNLFGIIAVSGQSNVVADQPNDTLTLVAGTGVSITTNATTDEITLTNTAPNVDQNLFQTIAVSGQSNVVADSPTDTLTLVAGTNISITTNATTDEITINSTAVANDELVKVSANDTTSSYLENKVVGAANEISVTTLNDGGDEDLEIGIADNPVIPGSEGMVVPSGTTAERPSGSPITNGTTRYNETLGVLEYYANGEWATVANSQSLGGVLLPYHFLWGGGVENAWMGSTSQHITSNISPYIIPWDARIVGLGFNNKEFEVNDDIEIYLGTPTGSPIRWTSTRVLTVQARDVRAFYVSNLDIAVSQGQAIGVYVRKIASGNIKPDLPLFTVYTQTTADFAPAGYTAYQTVAENQTGGRLVAAAAAETDSAKIIGP